VIRYIPHEIPRLEELMLHDLLKDLAMERRGLLLVVGAARIGQIDHDCLDARPTANELATGHILTFEDPIEFLFRNKKSIVQSARDRPRHALARGGAAQRDAPGTGRDFHRRDTRSRQR